MSLPYLSRAAVAGVTVAAGLAYAGPASAAVTYDPETKTGFIGRSDVRKVFGWTDAVLAARASALVFDHAFRTDDTYAVSCAKRTFTVVHHRDYGRLELSDTVVRGYGTVTGFRLDGPHLGISGTSVPPAPGQDCPDQKGATIDRVRMTLTTTGWTLNVRLGDVSRPLAESRKVVRQLGTP
jgi:hypothetical protein